MSRSDLTRPLVLRLVTRDGFEKRVHMRFPPPPMIRYPRLGPAGTVSEIQFWRSLGNASLYLERSGVKALAVGPTDLVP